MATAAPEKSQAKYVDYSDNLRNLREMLERAVNDSRYAQGEAAVGRSTILVSQLREAIEVLEEAQTIEATPTQFGTPYSQEWSTTVAPGGLLEYRGYPGLQIKAWDYKVVTDDPRQIAHLRRCVERDSLPGLREMEPGLMCAMSQDGFFYDWLPPQQYDRYIRSGSGRGW